MNSLYRGISLAVVFWTTVSMSAYTPHETGSRTTASGARAKEGYTCAANFVPMGSVIIYEGHKIKKPCSSAERMQKCRLSPRTTSR